jgi:hypothetical protein
MANGWRRHGLVLARSASGPGANVVGDPCIVWDDEAGAWRMFFFFDPPGHGHALATERDILRCRWQVQGPLRFANPDALLGGGTHKPWLVMDPLHPNRASRIEGRFCLLTVSYADGHKLVQRAWSPALAGPWTLEPEALIGLGTAGAFDEKHVDAISGYYFEERKEFLYFYMGYPLQAQDRGVSPYGNAQAVATQRFGERFPTKYGMILPPCQEAGHWASGWVGGLQLLPGKTHRWIGLVNASPTAPDLGDKSHAREEPAPSLGGFAFCDEAWPVRRWSFFPAPIERIEDIPETARRTGESTNLWRQHIVRLENGGAALLYNSGFYGQEQLYMKSAEALL